MFVDIAKIKIKAGDGGDGRSVHGNCDGAPERAADTGQFSCAHDDSSILFMNFLQCGL